MSAKCNLLTTYVNRLNNLALENQGLFVQMPQFYMRDTFGYQKGTRYEVHTRQDQIYLKSKQRNLNPYIEMDEIWEFDNNIGYCYRFVIPYFDYSFKVNDPNDSTQPHRQQHFQFRYEVHANNQGHVPKHHLHVLDGVPPTYRAEPLDFIDFFEIIKKDFTKNDVVDFDY